MAFACSPFLSNPQAQLDPVRTSLVAGFDERIRGSGGADVLLFNPPYVPTGEDEWVVPGERYRERKQEWSDSLAWSLALLVTCSSLSAIAHRPTRPRLRPTLTSTPDSPRRKTAARSAQPGQAAQQGWG